MMAAQPELPTSRWRAYTIRRFDPVSKKLDLDFVLHGDKGTSKNSRYRSRATRLSSNDSGLFSFRFVDVHSRTVRDWQRNQFFEVPKNHAQRTTAPPCHFAEK